MSMFDVGSKADLTRVIQECLDKIEKNTKDIKKYKKQIKKNTEDIEEYKRRFNGLCID